MLVVTGVAAVVGIVIAREFGRTDETDGFFAAYGVFLVLVLAAQAIRIAVIPALARAREERRLAGELAGFAVAIAIVAAPLVLVTELATNPLAELLTGSGPEAAQSVAADSLRWMVPAAAAHLFAGLAASGLAALDDYVTAAVAYGAGSAAGLAVILVRVESDGIEAVAWAMAVNGAISLAVPVVALALRALRLRMPAQAVRPIGAPLPARLGTFAAAAALPLALQLLYVVCIPFAGREGVGAQTSLAYAYLAASPLIAITASSIGLVTSAPLTRSGVDASRASLHIVSASWLALAAIGAAAGVSALAGADVVEAVLGDAYGGNVGGEVGRLIALLAPWMAVSVGVSVAFPLIFVVGRTRSLVWIGAAALALQIPLAWAAQTAAGLDGLALSLACSTGLVLFGLLHELEASASTARGLGGAAVVVAVIAVVAFVPAAFVLDSFASAAVGLMAYIALLAVLRPRGLVTGWRYLRALS
jgi:O-antigen/teichoic acid export membrane protein